MGIYANVKINRKIAECFKKNIDSNDIGII
jgi:hypothetical protein